MVPAPSTPADHVLSALAALDAGASSQLFVLMLADLLPSLFDDAAHTPPSINPLPNLLDQSFPPLRFLPLTSVR